MEPTSSKIRLVIDANHLMYRHWSVSGELCSSSGEKTGTMFGVLKSIKMFCEEYKPEQVIFCRDQGRSFRKDLLETYKGTRGPRNEEEVIQESDRNDQFEKTFSILECLGIPVVGVDCLEADDIVAIVTKRIAYDGITIVISGDKDLLQLVDDRTKYYHPHYNKLVSMTGWVPQPGEDFLHTFNRRKEVHPLPFTQRTEGIEGGVDFSRWLLYRSLVGDSSDDLSGIKGIAEITAGKIVKECATWQEIMSKKDTLKLSPRVKNELTEDNLKLQGSIIDLTLIANSAAADVLLPDLMVNVQHKPADIDIFRKLLLKYEMKSIVADLRSFIKFIPLRQV